MCKIRNINLIVWVRKWVDSKWENGNYKSRQRQDTKTTDLTETCHLISKAEMTFAPFHLALPQHLNTNCISMKVYPIVSSVNNNYLHTLKCCKI